MEEGLDKRPSMGVVGDLNRYTQFQAAESMRAAAENPGGGEASAGMGLGMGMAMVPQQFFFALPKAAQENLYRWLSQINRSEMPKNNWVYFRVLVNTGFAVCGLPYDQARLDSDFALINGHYEGDGWYFDYSTQRDYYIPWAFQFYGLVYAHLKPKGDNAEELIKRAKQYAPDFACWFADTGEGVPYGRSLTYRFAQSAFFAAQAYAGAKTNTVGYGEMKHILLQNLRYWFQQPIFTRDGVLTIGYRYPNLLMAEGYNAPGSPYWSMKSFLCLAMAEDHPFWQAEEKAPRLPAVSAQPHARHLIVRSDGGRQVTAYQAGNHCEKHAHNEAKYEKFAYSTAFGFSVSKCRMYLDAGAFDSMLAVSRDSVVWYPRYGCESFEIRDNGTYAAWKPIAEVQVETEIYPVGAWHIRKHHIHTGVEIRIAEGGFAISAETYGDRRTLEREAAVLTAAEISGIRALQGYDSAEIVGTEPNTNLLSQRALLPTLHAVLQPGDHTLVCAVLGTLSGEGRDWEIMPKEVTAFGALG